MKNLKIILIVSLVVLFIVSGGLFLIYVLKKQSRHSGTVVQKEFLSSIPYETENGLIHLKPFIDGKEYNFLFDTGAFNVVSTEVAKELGLKTTNTSNAIDSQDNTQEISISKIPSIKIGGIEFINYSTAIIDFSQQERCSEIDGIIGSNLMKDAIWMIDQENKRITFSNSRSKINLKGFDSKLPFSTDKQFIPYVKMNILSGHTETVMVDTGYTSGLLLTTNKNSIPNDLITNEIEVLGSSDFGVFKKKIEEVNDSYFKLKSITIDQFKYDNVIVYNSQNTKNKMGVAFFKGYNYVLDWDTNEMLLELYDLMQEKIL